VGAGSTPTPGGIRFAHPSEEKLAELLDFYGVRWEYEPVEFVLAWDREGRPAAAFRPDFYLPEQNCFLELTTLRQELVTRKNRKLRRLAELYPAVTVRLLYRRDYAQMLLRAELVGRARQQAAPGRGARRSA
jgi:hypoxanthine phosphoribosyltransferase